MRPGTAPGSVAEPERACESPCAIGSGQSTADIFYPSETDHKPSYPSPWFPRRKASESLVPEATGLSWPTFVEGYNWGHKHCGSSGIAALLSAPPSWNPGSALLRRRHSRQVDKKKPAKRETHARTKPRTSRRKSNWDTVLDGKGFAG